MNQQKLFICIGKYRTGTCYLTIQFAIVCISIFFQENLADGKFEDAEICLDIDFFFISRLIVT